ncbi:MAG: sugar phosphate isomerase/epimerase [Methanoregulaceae archaeon]|jgi:sugar phosphate isomerase/epimerase|nr:sugar phosphate isomerase/epimerase [Methanolinea sp.]MCC7567508.1 sugar phosphate isomerase/epimerase [Methanoregulaceae archaeon]MDD3090140.1 sugar phosphate isomerase/epimerase [Methanoregulaceae archaeon]MDD5047685.1 sugar phosphate isomerase/epimerase [Methanoregulaceae archaeon]MDD5684492.1 sugar phosphate isomerase/epimerase [Methanoregulaceae archaeon]
MVYFAVSSMFFHEYPLEEIFDLVCESGLDTLEFWMETPHFWLRDLPEDELAACIQKNPDRPIPSIHAPVLDLNPCSINPDVAAISVEYTERAISLAGRIGSGVVTVHPGRRTAKRSPSDADYRRFEYYLDRLEEVSRGKNVTVAIENMERKVNSLLCTPESVRELLDREEWLGFTLDVSHAMGTSTDEVYRYLDLCHDRLSNIHMSRSNGGTQHLPVRGSRMMADILVYICDLGYTGCITLEIEDRNFAHDLSSEEKIIILAGEVEFMRNSVG